MPHTPEHFPWKDPNNPDENETQFSAAEAAKKAKFAQQEAEKALSWIDASANLFPDKSTSELANIFLTEEASDALRQTLLDEIIARVEKGEEDAMRLAGEFANRKPGEFYWPNQARRISREVLTRMIDQTEDLHLRQKALQALYPHAPHQKQGGHSHENLRQTN